MESSLAKRLQVELVDRPLLFHKLEAGMGGCPWRVGVAVLVRYLSKGTKVSLVLGHILTTWWTPEKLAGARQTSVYELMLDHKIEYGGRKARNVIEWSQGWLGEWATVYDLPHAGKAVVEAIAKHCPSH